MGTESEKLFSIYKRKDSCCEVKCREMQRDQEAMIEITEGLYQVSNDFLEELGAFLHLVLRPSQLDNVTFLCRVGEIDNDLEVDEIKLW